MGVTVIEIQCVCVCVSFQRVTYLNGNEKQVVTFTFLLSLVVLNEHFKLQ